MLFMNNFMMTMNANIISLFFCVKIISLVYLNMILSFETSKSRNKKKLNIFKTHQHCFNVLMYSDNKLIIAGLGLL